MSIPSWARKGAKVVCTDGGDPTCGGAYWGVGYPITGVVYTVEKAFICDKAGYALLHLVEHPSPHPLQGWAAHRFAPVVEDRTEAVIYKRKRLHVPAPTERERA